MEELKPHFPRIKVPQPRQKIHKDECVFSFDTPETSTGLFVCLNTFLGMGKDHLERYHRKTGNGVFLNIKREKHEIPAEQQSEGPDKKITRLAIGVEGGFYPDLNKKNYEYTDTYSIVVLPSFHSFPYPNEELPELVKASVKAVLEADSASKMADLEAMAGTWDGEARQITKYANSLQQLDNGKKVPPQGWQCEKCDLTQNLWLNLTDGSILCGRRYHDNTGGNGHAAEHYQETKHPLAVKLGTISKEGKADVYSYPEDDMVEDPNLAQHLAHFGININLMEKTDRSMAELELDLNQKIGEWAALQEAGSHLQPLSGPGYVGLTNLGNSCYLNSVMQVLFTIPDFQKRFFEDAPAILENVGSDPAEDFNIQMAKLGVGLLSDKYVTALKPETPEEVGEGLKPQMFKSLIGKGHPDFSTKRQQDAQEFFLHIINILERNSRHQGNPAECFKFKVEDRFECMQSHKVKYTYRSEYCLPLPIPLEEATNKAEVDKYEQAKLEAEKSGQKLDPATLVRPHIKLESCLSAFSQFENVEQFFSTAINDKTTAKKSTRLATFPDYLVLHLKKFKLREDWMPIKLDVAVEMPDCIDLSALRSTGLQPGEELLPELQGAPPAVHYDEAIIQQLVEMGFPYEGCKRAVYFTDNEGLEAATNWVMQHIADNDFSDPFVPPGTAPQQGSKADFVPNEDALAMISAMGFTRSQAVRALKATENNIERAADWIFSHQDELDAPEEGAAVAAAPQASAEPQYRDGSSKYQLVAFISHMGTSTMVGHYVCHILREGRWVIYNDEKVALSENPPKELGYLYLYKRV